MQSETPDTPQNNDNSEPTVSDSSQTLAVTNNNADTTITNNNNNNNNNNNDNNNNNNNNNQRRGFNWQQMFWNILIIYFLSYLFRGGNNKTADPTSSTSLTKVLPGVNLFSQGDIYDLYIYLSDDNLWDSNSNRTLVGKELNLEYRENLLLVQKHLQLDIANNYTHLYDNGSLYLHVFMLKEKLRKKDPLEIKTSLKSRSYVYKSKLLTRHKKVLIDRKKNLLTGKVAQEVEENAEEYILTHWHTNVSIFLIYDFSPWTKSQIPAPLDKYIEFYQNNYYFPIIFATNYWNLNKDYFVINRTLDSLDLYLEFGPLSLYKFQFYAALENQNSYMSMLQEKSDDDDDTLKETMLETDPILLGVTIVVSIIHTIFEVLAFKNDIQFWKTRDTLVGLSIRSVFFNVFQSIIVFLYIMDNDTNLLIIFGTGVALLIDLWKISKVMEITIHYNEMILGLFPRVSMKERASYAKSPTKEYDRMAFRYLSWVLFPLLFVYAIYSLIYNDHKGWYSFVLSMLYGFLLTFGFISMTPQLFINYKMKSVAHLPWRMMTYKFLNTFIDDLFAFVIKMPTLYRLGCFRDDIVFIVFLYQRWIYRVDPSRKNEYGISKNDITTMNNNNNTTNTTSSITTTTTTTNNNNNNNIKVKEE